MTIACPECGGVERPATVVESEEFDAGRFFPARPLRYVAHVSVWVCEDCGAQSSGWVAACQRLEAVLAALAAESKTAADEFYESQSDATKARLGRYQRGEL